MKQHTSIQKKYETIDFIIQIYKFLKKKALLILCSIALTIGLGQIFNFFIFKTYYQATMLISSRFLTNSQIANFITNLGELAYEENSKEIANLTNIPENLTKKIINIEIIETTLNELNEVAIQLKLSQKENLQIYQDGILYFLENNPYVKKKTVLYQKTQKELLHKIQKEIRHIDSVQKIIEAGNEKNKLIIDYSTKAYSNNFKLYEAQSKIKENLNLPNIQVIKSFSNLQKYRKYRNRDVLILCTVIGLIIGLFLALITELNKKTSDKL